MSDWAVELVADKHVFTSSPCSELIVIYSRGYLLDTLSRLYVRSGFHVGHGGKNVYSRVTTGIGKVLIFGTVLYTTSFKAVAHYW